MAKTITNSDRMLQSVLSDYRLVEYGGYKPDDYLTIDDALLSDNYVVHAVAQIIDGKENNSSDRDIYNIVTNYLKSTI